MQKNSKNPPIKNKINQIKDKIKDHIVYQRTVEQTSGIYEEFPEGIEKEIIRVYEKQGISRIYSHQAEAYRLLSDCGNIIVTTPTASGKSLCYNLYVFDRILKSKKSGKGEKAFYIFPTKALASDQREKTLEFSNSMKELNPENNVEVYQYDGDTPTSVRQAIRVKGDLVITNPDMLHAGILPNHTKWSKFFSNLSVIVIDEVHIYRGVFGSHLALLIERLKRIASFYGNSSLQFILLSATISNPAEHGEKLINDELLLINENGAPTQEKTYCFFNPPLISDINIRRGILLETIRLAGYFIKERIQTINFLPSRLLVELVYTQMIKKDETLANKISPYRGGYLPGERKKIEKGIRERELTYICTTNALELGIDIGSFEACIISGFPGSISSFFQQAGRAGRNHDSFILFIASNSPIDQYLMDNPTYFFEQDPEKALINPLNIYIYNSHLKCALFELPFRKGEIFYNIDPGDFLELLEEDRVARNEGGDFYYADAGYPAEDISMRSATEENFVIVDISDEHNTVIGEMDKWSVFTLLFPKAIYIHKGELYEVKELDLENNKAYIKETKAQYYTDSLSKTDIEVLNQLEKKEQARLLIEFDDILVRTTPTKYKKLKFYSNENIGYGDIHLPSIEMHTQGLFIGIRDMNEIMGKAGIKNADTEIIAEIISSFAYLSQSYLPLFLFCDRNDIGVSDFARSPFYGIPGFFIYDKIPGGINLASEAFNHFPFIIDDFIHRIDNCNCQEGCPSCIGITDPGSGYKKINKKMMRNFLKGLVR